MLQARPVLIPSLLSSVILLSGCQTLGTTSSDTQETDSGSPNTGINKTVAQVGGGLLGGLIGNQFGGGNGKTLMTIAGAIGGAYLGGELLGDEGSGSSTQKNKPNKQTKIPEVAQTQPDSTLNKFCHTRIKYYKDVPVQVDVAYVRYKRNFGFMTQDESNRAQGLDPQMTNKFYLQMDNGFRHIVEPGVRYHMKDEIDLDTGYYIGWLSLELEKAGQNKTRVYVNYCEGGENGFDSKYSKVIRKKVNNGYI